MDIFFYFGCFDPIRAIVSDRIRRWPSTAYRGKGEMQVGAEVLVDFLGT